MNKKKADNLDEVERIKGTTSRLLVLKCPDGRSVFPSSPCSNGGCDFQIKKPGYMNCTFVAATAEGCDPEGKRKRRGMTLASIGEAMELTPEGVRKIERKLLDKLRPLIDPEADVESTPDQPRVAARRGHLQPNDQADVSSDERDVVRAHRGRVVAQR